MLSDKIRRSALKKARSPEQLDAMLTVVPPLGWLASLLLVASVFAFLIWALVATAPVKVDGSGILLTEGEIVAARAQGTGIVVVQPVKVGDRVQAGDLLARLENFKMQEGISQAKAALARGETMLAQIREVHQKFVASLEAELADAETFHQDRTSNFRDRIVRLAKLRQERQVLFDKGLIVEQKLLETLQALEDARQNLSAAQFDFSSTRTTALADIHESQSNLAAHENQILTDRERLKELQADYQRIVEIRAAAAGIVTESTKSIGDQVSANDILFEILPEAVAAPAGQPETPALLAVLYVDASHAARLEPGGAVQVVPASVELERDGFIHGQIIEASVLPATQAQLLKRLQNPDLVAALSANGPVREVLVTLAGDARTASGLAWSTQDGPAFRIHPGTLTTASFVVDRKRIASFVFPKLDALLPALAGRGPPPETVSVAQPIARIGG
ncbi:NHLP bacteriocin system secretion protein [Pseudophaeobacter arcticus]|jgi:HlyD family secretion protein|uniref:NHLP bacteriocin system secretion protein n=1 Tax=Pseudophaeobacter arcticus TaxID=385492 RepID=UPI0039E55842